MVQMIYAVTLVLADNYENDRRYLVIYSWTEHIETI